MNATHLRATRIQGRRLPLALILGLALLSRALGAPEPAHAQDPIVHDHRMGGPPVAHVQVHASHIKIFDDRDGRFAGDGEFEFWFTLICREITSKCLGYQGVGLDGFSRNFSAGSGETYTFDVVMPVGAPTNPSFHINPDTGYPLRPDHEYVVMFGMMERDRFTDYEKMGQGEIKLVADNNWGIGTYTVRSTRDDGSAGDYELTFEVRPVILPDLRPINIVASELPGGAKHRICTPVQNFGSVGAGQFDVILQVNNEPLIDGRGSAPGLAPSGTTEVCAEAQLPTSGNLKLTAVVDPLNGLPEYNEANNVYEITHTVAQKPGPAPKPTTPLDSAASTLPAPGQGAELADLTVGAIKVNGQAPDRKHDCTDGKNDVVVVVKNLGAAGAEGFAVRLLVDDGDPVEKSIGSLDTGQEREVRFGDVRLKKGEHKLTATVDPKNTVAESNADNNDLRVTAACKDDD